MEHIDNLKADCEKCFGLCCTALYFSSSEGFPIDKETGKPCINLKNDFKCKVHKDLNKKGLKGCIAYDCFGAGQKLCQVTYKGQDWREVPESSKNMFEAFLVMRQIHEMLWYLSEAFRIQLDNSIKEQLKSMFDKIEKFTQIAENDILKLDITPYRIEVNKLLFETSNSLRNKIKIISKKKKGKSFAFMGADLRKKNLKGEDLSGAFLIASNLSGMDLSFTDFLGADLRDADIRGADLAYSIYLTQGQINSAKGNSKTILPKTITKPFHWEA